jgi:hypothetical protein
MKRYDHRETYCRSLGDCVHFSYCRSAGGNEPCGQILDCWIGRLPVAEFLREHYGPHMLRRLASARPDRLQRLVSIAERTFRSRPPEGA